MRSLSAVSSLPYTSKEFPSVCTSVCACFSCFASEILALLRDMAGQVESGGGGGKQGGPAWAMLGLRFLRLTIRVARYEVGVEPVRKYHG